MMKIKLLYAGKKVKLCTEERSLQRPQKSIKIIILCFKTASWLDLCVSALYINPRHVIVRLKCRVFCAR